MLRFLSNCCKQNCLSMRKFSLLFVTIMTLFCICFTSCEKESSNVVKGVWKYIPHDFSSVVTSFNLQEIEMTYVFDGKGYYTFTSNLPGYEYNNTNGTYEYFKDNENIQYVVLHGVAINSQGEKKEYNLGLWLYTTTKPYTLETTFCDDSGNVILAATFEKQ